jgi:hypothetical protein
MDNFFSRFPARRFCALLVLLLLAYRLPVGAQAPGWQSARTIAQATYGSIDDASFVSATAVDAAGNVFLAGSFKEQVVLGTDTLTSRGGYDVFVAKFSPARNRVEWAQQAGGTLDDLASALTVSGTSVYVTGYFRSTLANFGAISLTNIAPTNLYANHDVFVAKLTDAGSSGRFVWAQLAGGTRSDIPTSLAVSGPNVYVAGNTESPTADFGSTHLRNTNPAYVGGTFVAKLIDAGPTGSFAWAQLAGTGNYDVTTALAVSGANVYLAGSFSGLNAAFGPYTLNAPMYHDGFVAKLIDAGPTGSFAWVQQLGDASDEFAMALAVNGPSVYVAGSFSGPMLTVGSTTLTSAGNQDVFVVKLTDAGAASSVAWAQQAGGTNRDVPSALAVSGTSVYVAGAFASPTVPFGSTTLAKASGGSYYNLFVAQLADAGPSGRFAWAQQAGGLGGAGASALAISGTTVYVAGGIDSGTVTFGSTTLFGPNISSLGFLAAVTDRTLAAITTSRSLPPAQLFPNPASHTITLRLPVGAVLAPLTLTNGLGQTVRHYPAPVGLDATLDLQGLAAGFYLLRGVEPTQRLLVK